MPIAIDNVALLRQVAQIEAMPPGPKRERAQRAALLLLGAANAQPQQRRHPPSFWRKYAGRPHEFCAEVFERTLTDQQRAMWTEIEAGTHVIIATGTNLGKSDVLALYGLYVLLVLGSVLGAGNRPRGARVLIVGPSHATLEQTCYARMLSLAAGAERRGYSLLGKRSEASVSWVIAPEWSVEGFSPPSRAGQTVAATVSGRHAVVQVGLCEEGSELTEPVLAGVEGMMMGHQEGSTINKIVVVLNPTVMHGPVYARTQGRLYRTRFFSSHDHPNVRERRVVIPGAVTAQSIEARILDDCADLGAWPAVQAEEERGDFVWALPPGFPWSPTAERGPREDGHQGHPDGELRVYRPNPAYRAKVQGCYAADADGALFQPTAIQAAMDRWCAGSDPLEPPTSVGCDPARDGSDSPVSAPRWGETGEELLRAYEAARAEAARATPERAALVQPPPPKSATEALAERMRALRSTRLEVTPQGLAFPRPKTPREPAATAADAFRAARRMRLGALRVLRNGDGPEIAEQLARAYPHSPFVLDEGSVGSSPLDWLAKHLRRRVVGVSFGARAPVDPPPELPWCANMRTYLAVLFARLVNLGLVDLPPDELLRQEMHAHYLRPSRVTLTLTVAQAKRFGRRPGERYEVEGVQLVSKDDVKLALGRSPDRFDAAALACHGATPRRINFTVL